MNDPFDPSFGKVSHIPIINCIDKNRPKTTLPSFRSVLTKLFKFLHYGRLFDRPLIGQIHQSSRVLWLP